MKIVVGKRKHRGTLEESLKTKVYITDKEFLELLPKYKSYGYDERCKQLLYIAKDIENEEYTWLFYERIDNEIK